MGETPMAVILVAEDEPLIRLNAALLFEDAGFEVVEAATARAALAMLEKREGKVLALFTDVDMPGDMNGLELAGIVHRRWPEVALIITSGVVRAPAFLPGGGVFLPKPYLSDDPVKLVREFVSRTAQENAAKGAG